MATQAYGPRTLLKIGQFSVLSGLSIKTLRHYDAQRVLRPAAVDERTRYRAYAPEQLADANRISVLRASGLTLKEIVGADLAGLVRARKRIERELARDQAGLRMVDALFEVDHAPVTLKYQPRIRIARIREQLSTYDDVDELFREIESALPSEATGLLYGAVWHGCAPGAAIDCEAFVEVVRPRALLRGRVTPGVLPERTVATMLVDSSSEVSLREGYRTLHRWLACIGQRALGPKAEWYLRGRETRSNGLAELRFNVSSPFDPTAVGRPSAP